MIRRTKKEAAGGGGATKTIVKTLRARPHPIGRDAFLTVSEDIRTGTRFDVLWRALAECLPGWTLPPERWSSGRLVMLEDRYLELIGSSASALVRGDSSGDSGIAFWEFVTICVALARAGPSDVLIDLCWRRAIPSLVCEARSDGTTYARVDEDRAFLVKVDEASRLMKGFQDVADYRGDARLIPEGDLDKLRREVWGSPRRCAELSRWCRAGRYPWESIAAEYVASTPPSRGDAETVKEDRDDVDASERVRRLVARCC